MIMSVDVGIAAIILPFLIIDLVCCRPEVGDLCCESAIEV
jgi:hypothetical protein